MHLTGQVLSRDYCLSVTTRAQRCSESSDSYELFVSNMVITDI